MINLLTYIGLIVLVILILLIVILIFARAFGKIMGRAFLSTLKEKFIFLKGDKNGKNE